MCDVAEMHFVSFSISWIRNEINENVLYVIARKWWFWHIFLSWPTTLIIYQGKHWYTDVYQLVNNKLLYSDCGKEACSYWLISAITTLILQLTTHWIILPCHDSPVTHVWQTTYVFTLNPWIIIVYFVAHINTTELSQVYSNCFTEGKHGQYCQLAAVRDKTRNLTTWP